ncbi:MAG: hypothetical protein OEM49_05935 [Myxococcales bacterium]|nr:hypothetical protein [Myxococcales bacterium]
MKRALIGIALAIAFVAVPIFVALDHNRVSCEVCMSYRGRQVCEQSSAIDRDEALMQAIYSACSRISSGVTDGIQCNNSRPLSSECSDR